MGSIKLDERRASLVVETAWQVVIGIAKSAGNGIPHHEALELVRGRLAAIDAALPHVCGVYPAVGGGNDKGRA